jgi:hypothetical protein
MRRLNEFITEDTNQFGPGTDLVVSLAGVLMVLIFISSFLYGQERKRAETAGDSYKKLKLENQSLRELIERQGKKLASLEQGGNFKLASRSFLAADFKIRPVTQLADPARAEEKIFAIAQEYQGVQTDFPFIFIIGHSNQIDDPSALDQSYGARLQRNWEYAGRRAGVIAGLLQKHLKPEQQERIVVISTGEFDLKIPSEPLSPENAWVEIVFGKEWKLPARLGVVQPH